jgi:hypothetical protein
LEETRQRRYRESLTNPSGYLRVVAALLQRDQPGPLQNDFDHPTDRELIEQLSKEARRLLRLDEMGDLNAGI